MTTPLFLLRCVQIGLSLTDLDLLTIGMVNEIFIEKDNDDYDYPWQLRRRWMPFNALRVSLYPLPRLFFHR